MMVLICSAAELCKQVGTVIPSNVNRCVGDVGFSLPEEQKVPLTTNCLEALEAPMDEGFVRGRGDGRVREIDCVKGVGAVRANLVASEVDAG